MPLTPPGIAATVSSAMAGEALTGIEIPHFALGVGLGVCQWTSTILTVTTVDVGTGGAGSGLFACLIPQPLLLSSLISGFASNGLVGTSVPQLIRALANGLSLGFAQGLITTTHPTVGTGTATVTFVAGTATPSMLSGFASSGMTGTSIPQMAAAIAAGLETAFTAFTLPIPIVGASASWASTGTGAGKVL